MKAKKILAMIMAAALSVSAFTACSAAESSSTSSADSSSDSSTSSEEEGEDTNMDGDLQLNEPGALPLVLGDEPAEISIFTAVHVDTNSVFESETNLATAWYEEQTNTHITWTTVSSADKTAKLNLLFQSNSYEDIILFTMWDSATQYAYGSQGYLISLNEYYENGDSYWWDIYSEAGLESGDLSQMYIDDLIMPDGNIYSMAQGPSAFHSLYAHRLYIYEPWLEALDLDMPTTTDEFYDVLYAFKTQDPNGNGIADEIPMSGSLTGWNTNPITFLMNSFTYYTTTGYYELDGDQVVMTYTKDEYKDGLDYVATLVADGLLTTDFYTNDATMLKASATQDTQILGATTAGSWATFTSGVTGTEGDWTNYVTVAPLEGPDGVQYSVYFQPTFSAKAHITDNCEYPRLAFRMIDYMYEEECGMNLKNGIGGWEYIEEEGVLAINGEDALYTMISLPESTNYGWSQIGVANEPAGWHSYQAVLVDDVTLDMESGLYNSGAEYAPYEPEEEILVPNLIFDDATSEQVIDYTTQINEYITSQTAIMITTDTVEEEWEAFQAQLELLGVEELTAIYQTAYEERLERVG